MLAGSFIVGLFIGVFIGVILLSLLVARKKKEMSYCMSPGGKTTHPIVDQKWEDIFNEIAYC